MPPLPFFQRLVGKWLPEEMFLELFAVGGCLPGPTSTQVGGRWGELFAVGGCLSGAAHLHAGEVMYMD